MQRKWLIDTSAIVEAIDDLKENIYLAGTKCYPPPFFLTWFVFVLTDNMASLRKIFNMDRKWESRSSVIISSTWTHAPSLTESHVSTTIHIPSGSSGQC